MDFGYPRFISEGFPGLNSTINAALHKDGEENITPYQVHAFCLIKSFFMQ